MTINQTKELELLENLILKELNKLNDIEILSESNLEVLNKLVYIYCQLVLCCDD